MRERAYRTFNVHCNYNANYFCLQKRKRKKIVSIIFVKTSAMTFIVLYYTSDFPSDYANAIKRIIRYIKIINEPPAQIKQKPKT